MYIYTVILSLAAFVFSFLRPKESFDYVRTGNFFNFFKNSKCPEIKNLQFFVFATTFSQMEILKKIVWDLSG